MYDRVVEDMYQGRKTVVRCGVGVTECFHVKVGLHQGLAVSQSTMVRLKGEERRRRPIRHSNILNNVIILYY